MALKRKRRERKDRRQAAPSAPVFGELLLESGWMPHGAPAVTHAKWLRAVGALADRRRDDRRAGRQNANASHPSLAR